MTDLIGCARKTNIKNFASKNKDAYMFTSWLLDSYISKNTVKAKEAYPVVFNKRILQGETLQNTGDYLGITKERVR